MILSGKQPSNIPVISIEFGFLIIVQCCLQLQKPGGLNWRLELTSPAICDVTLTNNLHKWLDDDWPFTSHSLECNCWFYATILDKERRAEICCSWIYWNNIADDFFLVLYWLQSSKIHSGGRTQELWLTLYFFGSLIWYCWVYLIQLWLFKSLHGKKLWIFLCILGRWELYITKYGLLLETYTGQYVIENRYQMGNHKKLQFCTFLPFLPQHWLLS